MSSIRTYVQHRIAVAWKFAAGVFPISWLDKHKMTHQGWSLRFLQHYEGHVKAFLSRIFTEDETLVLHSTSESNAESLTWKHPRFPVKKKFKTVQSPEKMITAVFLRWSSVGCFHTSQLNNYCSCLLGHSKETQGICLAKETRVLTKVVILLHQA